MFFFSILQYVHISNTSRRFRIFTFRANFLLRIRVRTRYSKTRTNLSFIIYYFIPYHFLIADELNHPCYLDVMSSWKSVHNQKIMDNISLLLKYIWYTRTRDFSIYANILVSQLTIRTVFISKERQENSLVCLCELWMFEVIKRNSACMKSELLIRLRWKGV